MFNSADSLEQLFNKQINCPLCGLSSKESRYRFKVLQLSWMVQVIQCNKCKLVYKEFVPNERLLQLIYSNEYGHFTSAAKEQNLSSRVERLGRPHGRLLDYGCGLGEFVFQANKAGWDGTGCDPFLPDLSLFGNKAHLFNKVDAVDEAIKDLGTFDCVTMWAVAEHINFTPIVFLNLSSLLNENGRLIFNSPYGNSLISKTKGELWGMATLVEHIQFHTVQSVHFLAKTCGLQVEKIRYCGTPYPFGKTSSSDQGIPNYLIDKKFESDGSEHSHIETKNLGFLNIVKFIHNRLTGNANDSTFSNTIRNMLNLTRMGDHIEVTYRKSN